MPLKPYERIVYTQAGDDILDFYLKHWKILTATTVVLNMIIFVVGIQLILNRLLKPNGYIWICVVLAGLLLVISKVVKGPARIVALVVAIALLIQLVAMFTIRDWLENKINPSGDTERHEDVLKRKASSAFDYALLDSVNEGNVTSLSNESLGDLNLALQDGQGLKYEPETDEEIDIDDFIAWYVSDCTSREKDMEEEEKMDEESKTICEDFRRDISKDAFLKVYFAERTELPKSHIYKLFDKLGFLLINSMDDDHKTPSCATVEPGVNCKIYISYDAAADSTLVDGKLIRAKFVDWYVGWGMKSTNDANLAHSK